MEKINLKAMLLKRFKGATVIDGLIGNQTINRKLLVPKRITSFADFSIPKSADLDIKKLTSPILDKFEKDLVDKLVTDNNYSNLVIGNWGEFEIMVDPYSEKDKIRFVCNAYLDAIVK